MRHFSDQAPAKHSLLSGRTTLFLYFAAPVLIIPCLAFSGYELVQRFYSQAPMEQVIPVGEISALTTRPYTACLCRTQWLLRCLGVIR